MKIAAKRHIATRAPYSDLQPASNGGRFRDECWVWKAQDWSEGDSQTELLALCFATSTPATQFKDAFGRATDLNSKAKEFGDPQQSTTQADAVESKTGGTDTSNTARDRQNERSNFGASQTTASQRVNYLERESA